MERDVCKNESEYETEVNSRKNAYLSLADGAVFTFAAGTVPIKTILLYFMGNFTDSKILLGLLNTLYNLMYFTPQIIIAKRLQNLEYYKPIYTSMGILIRGLWLLIAVFTFLFADSKPALYMVIFYIFISIIGMCTGFQNNIWHVLMARVIPPSKLSSFLSWKASICGIFEIAGAYTAGIILSFGTYPFNYGYLFAAAFAVMMVTFFFSKRIVEPESKIRGSSPAGGRGYMNSLFTILKADRNFCIYLASTAFIAMGRMSLNFQVIYAKDMLSITVQQVALASTILFITQTIGYMLWGVIVKWRGLKLAGTLSGMIFLPSIILTLWMKNIMVFYLAIGLMSLAQSYRNSNEYKLVINLSPDKTVLPSYIGLRETILGPFFSLSSLIGGLILDVSSFTVLTFISFALMTAGIFVFAVKLKVPDIE